MIFYPKWLFTAGFTLTPWLMFIRHDCRDNKPLHLHEQVHQRQMREAWTVVFWFRYLLSKKWRQRYEVEAYKAQIAAGASLHGCAQLLSSMYLLGISYDKACALLKT